MNQTEGIFTGILGGLGVAGILDYFGIIHDGFFVMSIMLVVDYLFGVASAYILGESVESRKMLQGLYKKITRWLLPFIVAGALKWTGFPIEWLITAILGIIIFSEAYSIIGHIYSINTKEKLPELDAFKLLLGKLATFFKKLVNTNLEKIDEENSSELKQKENKEE